jgi:hypothetical protein
MPAHDNLLVLYIGGIPTKPTPMVASLEVYQSMYDLPLPPDEELEQMAFGTSGPMLNSKSHLGMILGVYQKDSPEELRLMCVKCFEFGKQWAALPRMKVLEKMLNGAG